jgi:Fe-S-cluster containining protein
VLDPASGLCELYSRRPRVCRTFGPPLRLQHGDLAECPYCFDRVRPADRERLRVDPDPTGEEDRLLDALERLTDRRGLTLITLALRGVREEDPV